jgi:zinc transporter ZupT
MIELLGISFLVMLASLVGVLAVWKRAGKFIEQRLDYLVSFSAGVFLVFLFGLASEAVEHAGGLAHGLPWLLLGAVGIWAVFKFMPDSHVHTHADHSHTRLDARRLIVVDAIHNTADGIFLAASYAVSPALALVAGVSIFVHEALQEMSEFFVLKDAGYSTKKALAINFAVSSTILIGAVGGYLLLGVFEALEGPLLGLAAGGILTVVLHDLIPHSLREARKASHYAMHLLWFVVGAACMFGVTTLLPHVEAGAPQTAELAS